MHPLRRQSCYLALLIVVVALISSCAGNSASPVVPPASNTTRSITINDAAGRSVQIAKQPQRILVVGSGSYIVLNMLYLFPETKKLLVASGQGQVTNNAFLSAVDPTYKDKPLLENNATTEQIAALKPDLVFIKSTADPKLASGLEAVGIPSVLLGLETPDQLNKDVANVGTIFGDEARAKQILSFYQSRIDNISKKTASVSASAKPRTLTLDYKTTSNQVAFQISPESWMQTIEAKLAGGNPVWTEGAIGNGWIVTNFEQVAKWNPDKIFVIQFNNPNPGPVIAKLKADPQWQALKAVQNGELYAYAFDFVGWDSADPRWILGTEWMAKKLYPDLFKDLDMNQEVYQFYTQLYQMDKSSIDQNIVPKVVLDVK